MATQNSGGDEIDGLNTGQGVSQNELDEFEQGLTSFRDDKGGDQGGDQGDQGGQQGNQISKDKEDDLEDDELENEGRTQVSQEELNAGSEEERQQIRERKRLSQRQRQKLRIGELERQLSNLVHTNQDLAQRLASVENSNTGTQYAQLKQHASQIEQAIQQTKDIIADASVKGDGVRVAEATEHLVNLRSRQDQVSSAQAQLEHQARQPRQRPLSPEVTRHAQAFLSENSWYQGPKATDQDSRVLSSIDNALTAEGWDPATPVYWQELKQRAKKYLSHRFGETDEGSQGGQNSGNGTYNPGTAQQQRKPQRQAVAGGGGSNNSGGGANNGSYRLSAGRVEAMKAAGIWDDPERRKKMIARYQAADRESARNT